MDFQDVTCPSCKVDGPFQQSEQSIVLECMECGYKFELQQDNTRSVTLVEENKGGQG